VAQVVFDGDLELDVDGAAVALRRAGYTVHRMPEKYRPYLPKPHDDSLEVITADCDVFTIHDKIDNIVNRYGGGYLMCGPVEPRYEPFAEFLEEFMIHDAFRRCQVDRQFRVSY
jgi:hypothetical protein